MSEIIAVVKSKSQPYELSTTKPSLTGQSVWGAVGFFFLFFFSSTLFPCFDSSTV